jgi:hypothetical protein
MNIELFIASYLLGSLATWAALIPAPLKRRDWYMVGNALGSGLFWPVMAKDILDGTVDRGEGIC